MSNDRREHLRARIHDSSKDEVILDEMIRRGFWRENAGQPSLPAELIKRQGEVRRELDALAKDAAVYEDADRALKRVQAERMKAARERRIETKLKRAKARHDRAMAWHRRQGTEIAHLGDDVSAGLRGADGKPERLAQFKVPAVSDAAGLAAAMGIKLGELRFLAYDRKVAKIDHYTRFTIPKKTGGVREISAPMPRLKRAQYWILKNILEPLPGHEASHGFRAQRSILTNAHPHAGQRVVVNIDLKDFFPSITYARVKGFFLGLGYPETVAVPLALICTDAERDKLAIDGQTWSIARGERRLPQGAPTSPIIANRIATRLDKRMAGAAKAAGFAYTRYADDMTFSGKAAPGSVQVDRLLWQVREIAKDEGFTFNDTKTRIMGAGTRQDVTGLVVNARPAVARTERRRFRAWLHAAETARGQGGDIPQWTNAKGTASDALGFASYLAMVDAAHGAPLAARTKAVFAGAPSSQRRIAASTPGRPASVSRTDFRAAAGEGRAPTDTWWTPAERAAPVLERVVPPKPAQMKAEAQRSSIVPPIGAASRTAGPGPRRWGRDPGQPAPQPSAATPPPKPAPSLGVSLQRTLLLLPLLVLPVAGPLLAAIALVWIWRTYFQGRGGGS